MEFEQEMHKIGNASPRKWLKITEIPRSEGRLDINVGFSWALLFGLTSAEALWGVNVCGQHIFYISSDFSFPWMHDECRSGLEAERTSAHRHLGAPLTVITRLTANSGGQETATNPSPFSAPLLYQLFSAGPLKTVKPGGHQRCWSASDRPASPVGEGWMMMEWCKNREKKILHECKQKRCLFEVYVFIQRTPPAPPPPFPAASRAGAQCREDRILWSVLQESEQSGATSPL